MQPAKPNHENIFVSVYAYSSRYARCRIDIEGRESECKHAQFVAEATFHVSRGDFGGKLITNALAMSRVWHVFVGQESIIHHARTNLLSCGSLAHTHTRSPEGDENHP